MMQHVFSQLPSHRAPGPDGLPYELFSVPDVNLAAALLAFFELLLRRWAIVLTIWRSARVCALHKTGTANYRPMSLMCCSLTIFER